LKEMISFCGLDCHECGAFLAIKERDGDLVSGRCYWIREPKTPQTNQPEAYLWGTLEMRGSLFSFLTGRPNYPIISKRKAYLRNRLPR